MNSEVPIPSQTLFRILLIIFFCHFDCVLGRPFHNRVDDHIAEESSGLSLAMNSPSRSSPHSQNSDTSERFSRKVFVGGLPPDIDEGKKKHTFFHKCRPYLNQNIE